jgi:hypothetical protein
MKDLAIGLKGVNWEWGNLGLGTGGRKVPKYVRRFRMLEVHNVPTGVVSMWFLGVNT